MEAANYRLRRELGGESWELKLPGGQVVRSGDVVQSGGAVLPREVVRERAAASGTPTGEAMILESLRVAAERFKGELLESFAWPYAAILEESPLLVADRGPEDQFRTWLQLWPAGSVVWIGDVYDSGRAEHGTHFRPVSEWYQIGPVMGNYTCGSSFRPGTCQRSNAELAGHRFMVIESDTLTRDQVGAIFAWLNRRLRFGVHAIVDTGGKSLHGWFDAPARPALAERVKVALVALGCDRKVFTFSQPVRLPGAMRGERLQRLIWLRR